MVELRVVRLLLLAVNCDTEGGMSAKGTNQRPCLDLGYESHVLQCSKIVILTWPLAWTDISSHQLG